MSTSVIYIAGTGRSGSTLLASLLGEVEGCFAAGEVRYLWQRGLAERRLCGCGVPVRECPVWKRVLAESGHLDDPDRVEGVVSLLQRTGRIRNLPAILVGSLRPELDPARSLSGARDRAALGDVYAAMAHVTGSRVIVDSSKLPAYANVLAATPGIDLRVVHLIRDPRGAAHSWSSRKTSDRWSCPVPHGADRTGQERGALGRLESGGRPALRRPAGSLRATPLRGLRRRSARRRSAGSSRWSEWRTPSLPFVDGDEARHLAQPQRRGQSGPPSSRLDHSAPGRSLAHRDGAARSASGRALLTLPLLLHYGYTLRPADHAHAGGRDHLRPAPRRRGRGRHGSHAACAATFAGFAPRASRASSRRMSSTP